MPTRLLIFVFILLLTIPSLGQTKQEGYNILFPHSIGEKNWKIVLGLDARRSFFKTKPVKINGIRFGSEFRGVHRFGIGFYELDKHVIFSDIPLNYPDATDTSLMVFTTNYASVFYERVIYRLPKWEFATPLEFSTGEISAYYEDSVGIFQKTTNEAYNALSIAFQTKYFVFNWLAPRISIGQRFLFNTNPEIKTAFNKPYYSFGMQVLLGELYRTILEKEIFNLKENHNSIRFKI